MPSDTEMLDWLQKQNDKAADTGFCIFRWSATGRGWRLHETTRDGFMSVRDAISHAMALDDK